MRLHCTLALLVLLIPVLVPAAAWSQIAPLTVGYWDQRFGPPGNGGLGFSRPAGAIAAHPISGDVYVAGELAGFGLRERNEAIVRWTGSDWASLGATFNGSVNALAFGSDGTLYVAGDFTTINGASMSHVAAFDGSNWSALGGGIDDDVAALAIHPESGDLYAAGNFGTAIQPGGAAVASPDIVRWTGSSWEAVGGGTAGGRIYAIAFDPQTYDLLVGGEFGPGVMNSDGTLVGARSLARFDGTVWTDLENDAVPLSNVNALQFTGSGELFVAHGTNGGLARWDGSAWSVVAGGLGGVGYNGSRTSDDAFALAMGSSRLYVAGSFTHATQSDGSQIVSPGVVAYNLARDRFEHLGEGVNRATTSGHQVRALLVRPASGGEELFVGGRFGEAGAMPSMNIARWLSTPPFPATEVQFQLDLRTPMQLGLLHNLSFTTFTGYRPVVEVLSGAGAHAYLLYDEDGDSVWTARVPLPRSSSISYAYAIDENGNDFVPGSDWVYELGAPDGAARSAQLGEAPSYTLATAHFDNLQPRAVDLEYQRRSTNLFLSGNPAGENFPAGSPSGQVRIDPDQLDRPLRVAIRYYQKSPGGAAPEGVAHVAQSAFWQIDAVPASAVYQTAVQFDYSGIPGIAEPTDLRLLYRPHADTAWVVTAADVDVGAERIFTSNVTQLTGEWGIGSRSSANVLSTDPPQPPTAPRPAHQSAAAPTRPLLAWTGGALAQSFDLYLWEADAVEPASPSRSNIRQASSQWSTDLVLGTTYNWRVVSRNINGQASGPVWSFTVGSVPDLVVTDLDAPDAAFSGQPLTVTWSVRNDGDGGTNAPLWYDGLYLSDSPTFDPDAALLDRVRNLTFLDPKDQYTNSLEVTLPDGIEGTFYLHARADATDLLDEANEGDGSAVVPVQVTLTDYADLRVQEIAAPANVFSGDSLTIAFTVVNAGGGRTDAVRWYDSVFLTAEDELTFNFASDENEIRIRDTFLGRVEHTGALDAGESYSTSIRVKLPDDATGDLTLIVYADIAGGDKQLIRGETFEFNAELNNWTMHSMSSTLTPPPDLTVTQVSAPARAASGEVVDVQWTVENRGPGATRANAWSDIVYFSPTDYFDPATAVALGSFAHRGSLRNDEAYSGSGLVQVPHGASGEAHFFVRTDPHEAVFEHTFENNNLTGSTSSSQISRAPYPDLQVEDLSFAPQTLAAGEQLVVHYQIANEGDGAADEWADSLFVSRSESWDRAEAIAIAAIPHSSVLAPDTRRTHRAAVTLPPDLEGDYYLYLVADAAGRAFEHPDAINNVARSTHISVFPYPPVDLTPGIVQAPSAAISGESLELALQVTNTGAGRTTASRWTDRVYLSSDPSLEVDEDALLLEVVRESTLGGGDSYRIPVSVLMPRGVEGSYYLIVAIDGEGMVTETDEENNLLTREIELTIPTPVDLQVTEISAPASVQASQPVDISWTVTNLGPGETATTRWFDAVYLSRNETLDDLDVKLGVFEHNGTLTSGNSYQAALGVKIPAYASGTHYFLVRTDTRDDLYEHLAEGDNVAAVQGNVVLPPPSDLVVSDVSVPTTAIPGESVTVSWTLINAGVHPAQGVLRNAVYLSLDGEVDPDDPVLGVAEGEIDLAPGAAAKMEIAVDLARTYRLDDAGNLTAVVPGLLSGDYHAIVRADVAGSIRETEESNNAAASDETISVDVPRLALGTSVSPLLTSGATRYYRVDVPAPGMDVAFTVGSTVATEGSSALYVRRGSAPTAARFDMAAVTPFESTQEMTISDAEPGSYYLLVRAENVNGSTPFTVSAQSLDFSVDRVEPSYGGNTGVVTIRLEGAQFEERGRVFLQDETGNRLEATETIVSSSTRAHARLNLRGQREGLRTVVFVAEDGSETSWSESFEVVPGLGARPYVETTYESAVRSCAGVVVQVTVGNRGTENINDVFLMFGARGFIDPGAQARPCSDGIWLDDSLPWPHRLPEPSPQDAPRFFETPRGVAIMPLWLYEIAPGESKTFSILIDHFVPAGTVEHFARLLPMPESEFTRTGAVEEIESAIGYQLMLDAVRSLHRDAASAIQSEGFSSGKTAQNVSDAERSLRDAIADLGMSALPGPWTVVGGVVGAAGGAFVFKSIGGAIAGAGLLMMAGRVLDAHNTAESAADKVGDALDSSGFNTIGGDMNSGGTTVVRRAFDPNDIVGPAGIGAERWVSGSKPLHYKIRFENDPDLASAPAQVVDIRHPLDHTVDVRSFRLGRFGFGNLSFYPPENVSFYSGRLEVADSVGVDVDVTAGIDVLRNEAFWVLQSVDPETGTQPISDPFAGFLPVNDSTGIGEGFASYTIRPAEGAVTGDVIEAQAHIVFDANEPIDTPPVTNTIDADAPSSAVVSVPQPGDSTTFRLSWSGSDTGAGIAQYALYVSADEEPFQLYDAALSDTAYLFPGEPDRSYRFFTIASDRVGNAEALKTTGDVMYPVGPEDQTDPVVPDRFALHANYPNPFNPITTVPFDVARSARVEITVYNILGQRVLIARDETMQAGQYEQRLDLSRYASGVYFYEMRVQGHDGFRFRDIRKLVLVK